MLSRGVFLALLGCAFVARSQIPHWETSVTVFRRAVDVTSKNVIALNNLASELLIRNQPREALRYAQEAAGFTPWQMPWINVMSSHLVLNDYPSAQRAMLAALKRGRRSVGIDREPRYLDEARRRIAMLADGTLPYRTLGKPVHVPSGREKVAQVPDEWKRREAK